MTQTNNPTKSEKMTSKMTPLKLYKFIRHTPKGALVLSVFLIGFILRAPVAIFAPIVEILKNDFGVNSATIGLLSGIPVFCFALFSPLASYLIGKKGLEFTFITSISAILIGCIIRTFGDFNIMLLSTVLIGAGAALGNISIPLIAARDFPKKFSIITGIASATMNLGSFAGLALTAPLTSMMGWRETLALWILVSGVVLTSWIIYIFRKRRGLSRRAFNKKHNEDGEDGLTWKEQKLLQKAAEIATSQDSSSFTDPQTERIEIAQKSGVQNNETTQSRQDKTSEKRSPIWKQPFTYGVALVFICQCFGYFSLTGWLPQILSSNGLPISISGAGSSIFQVLGIVGSMTLGIVLSRIGFLRTFIIVAIAWLLVPLGLLLVPGLWWLWLILGGWAQSANYVLMFSAITRYAKGEAETRKLSASTQMSAYFIAGVSPSILGALHDNTGEWNTSLTLISCCMALMAVAGIVTYRKLDKMPDKLLNQEK